MSVFTDKATKYVPRLMKDLSISKVQACGIFGNIGGETGGFALLQEKSPTIKGSRGGYGWMQWTGPRRKKYEAWCATKAKNPAADETNYEYLVQETLTDEVKSLELLRKTTTIEAATETFMLKNLRPGIPHLEVRINWARKALAATNSMSHAGTAGVVIVAGTVAATQAPHNYIPYIIVGTVIAAIAGLLLASWYKHRKGE